MKHIFTPYTIGHFINDPGNRTDFEVLHFDNMAEPEVEDVHKHTFYEIIWTEQGRSRQTIDYTEHEVLPHSLFFISPNQVHEFEAWQPLSGGSILFTEDFFLFGYQDKSKLFELSFLDNLHAHPCIQLGEEDFSEVKATIDFLSKEHRRSDQNRRILQSLLHILLEQVQRFVDSARPEAAPSRKYTLLFKQFRAMLEQHFAENETVSFYAEALHITAHHLNLVCKQVTGLTATEVLRARSMLEAKRLLTFSDMTISEIATDLHFFDSSYFAKVFKREVGETPIMFQSRMSEKYRTKSSSF